jgi:hypothetical protein
MGLFFYNHIVPTKAPHVDAFLRSFDASGDDKYSTLAFELNRFMPNQILDFHEHIMPKILDERVLGLVYQSHAVIEKLSRDNVLQLWTSLYKRRNDEIISQAFFETSAAALIRHYDTARAGLNLLSVLSTVVKPVVDAPILANDLQTDQIDRAMVEHLRRVFPGRGEYKTFLDSSDTLRRIELPETLRVLLVDRIEAGYEPEALKLVSELFTAGRLSDRYIQVCREVVGDEAFLYACSTHPFHDESIRSVMKLAPIFGEEIFHTPQVLRQIRWDNDWKAAPPYILKFQQVGFDETALPILADFLCNNLDLAMGFRTDKKSATLLPDIARMATRMGKGSEALKSFVDFQIREFDAGDNRNPARLLSELRIRPGDTEISIHIEDNLLMQAITVDMFKAMVKMTGLEALRNVAPGARGEFIVDCLDEKTIQRNRREVFRIFPQTKAALLENDLGM